MELRVSYLELGELFLFLRQSWSGERFMPYNSAMATAFDALSEGQGESLRNLGLLTNGYLSALRALIDKTEIEITELAEDPSLLFLKDSDPVSDENILEFSGERLKDYIDNPAFAVQCGHLLRDLWRDVVCREKAVHSGRIFDKISSLRKKLSSGDPLVILSRLSDRFSLDGEELVFRIKPELRLKRNEITHLTVMPSVFASRDLTFWYSGSRLLIFLSLEDRDEGNFEPSDMDLLYTAALNDRTRLKMLRYISRRSCSAGDLAKFLHMNASTVSRHLKIFKDAGFVNMHSGEGKTVTYSICRPGIGKAFDDLKAFLFEEEE